jgi:hypothetical protein
MAIQSEEHRINYRAWDIVIRLTVVREGECISGHADLHRDGDHRCRLVLAATISDPAEMIIQLEAKARGYIDDWQSRPSASGTPAPVDVP